MKNTLFLLLLMLCTCLSAQTDSSATYSAKDVELKLESQKIELTKASIDEKITAQNNRIEEANKNLTYHITVVDIVLALFAIAVTVALSFGGYIINMRNKEATAKVENEIKELKAEMKEEVRFMREQTKEFKADTEKIVQSIREQADLKVEKLLATYKENINKSDSLLEEAKKHVSRIEALENKTKEAFDIIQSTKEGSYSALKKEVAENVIKEIKEFKPESQYTTRDWFLKGYNASLNKKLEQAAFYYRKATELKDFDTLDNETKAIYYNNWSNALSELGKQKEEERLLEDAIEKIEKAIDLDESSFVFYSNWGNALSNLAKLKKDELFFNESFKKYEKATKLNESAPGVYNNWGASMLELAKLRNSIIQDQEVIKEKLEKAYFLGEASGAVHLARLYSLLNDKEQAFDWLEKSFDGSQRNREEYEEDTDFANIRDEKRFTELLDKYRPQKGE